MNGNLRSTLISLVVTIAGACPGWARTSSVTMPDTVKVGEVVVTGTNGRINSAALPYSVSVIDRDQLEATGETQVLSAISGQVPSLFVTERSIVGFGVSNGGSGHIKLRGVGGDRASAVLMMVDGQPQFAGIYSHHVADFYDKEWVDRVEVVRGPASTLYGSNAMGGVINVITRQAQKEGLSATLSTQYGSYNTWLSSMTATLRKGRLSSLLSLSYNRTDGNVDNFDYKEASGYGKIAYELSDRWRATADYTLMNFIGNDPIYPKLSDPESTSIYHQNVTRGEASLAVSNDYGPTSGTARVYYSYGNHYIDDPRHFHSLDNRLGVMLYQGFTPWRGAMAHAGFDFNSYSGKIPMSGGNAHTPGSKATMDRKTITEYSPYVTLEQRLELGEANLFVNGGVRMSNSDKFDTRWIPQGGLSFVTGRWTVKASASMGYRNPSFRELYLYAMANPDLAPERMWNYEASVSHHFARWLDMGVTAYYSKGDNMIQVVDRKNVNTGHFINKGIEVTASSRLSATLTLSASYSYLHSSLNNLTGAPRNQYYLGLRWRPIKPLTIAADLKGIGDLYVADTVDDQSYAVVNLKVDYDVCRFFAVFLRLDNLTDARYVINRGYDMPGFTAMGGIRLKFATK